MLWWGVANKRSGTIALEQTNSAGNQKIIIISNDILLLILVILYNTNFVLEKTSEQNIDWRKITDSENCEKTDWFTRSKLDVVCPINIFLLLSCA